MAIDIRFPQITETSVEGQLRQLKSCLIQYSEKLNWALNTLEKNTQDVVLQYKSQSSAKASLESNPEEMASTFTALKGYIIKSADIVNAYSEVITEKLEGIYTAEATFPDGSAATYISKTANEIKATNDSITQTYKTLDKLIADLDARVKEITSDGYIKSGVLRYITEGDLEGAPLIGIEVGQTVSMDGNNVFNRFSRLTASGLEFYDSLYSDEKKPVAYITGYKMYITEANIESLVLGKYTLDTSDGIMFLWEGDVEEEEQRPLTIIVSAYGTSSFADFLLYVDGNLVKTYSGGHSTETLSYDDVKSAQVELLDLSYEEAIQFSKDGVVWTYLEEGFSQPGDTFDLLSLGSDTVYIRHNYYD